MFPFFFTTGTMGVAHSACVTADNTPSATKRSSSSVTFVLNAYGTGLAFKNLGTAPGRKSNLTGGPSSNPRPGLKRSEYSARIAGRSFWLIDTGLDSPGDVPSPR
uniref:Putative secreted protein n=1 Tax=Ixodes ricinus TaxID=34613 RepID=A0A6B0UHW6_IXORI